MKRGLALLLLALILSGCGRKDDCLERGMLLRERLLQSSGYSFEAEITSDYGDKIYGFSMQCTVNQNGNLAFAVNEPESIRGISGVISGAGGQLTFDDAVLTFDLLADGEVSPVSAPWLLIQTLQGGYLSSCGMDGEHLRLTIDDSYEEDALQLDIWLDDQDLPDRAEILWQGRRVLSLDVEDFTFV